MRLFSFLGFASWLVLAALAAACQPAAPSLPAPLGPAAVAGQPGRWAGPPAPAAAPEQRLTARVVPFWQAGKYGLMTPQGKVLLPATSPTMPVPVSRGGHVWAAEAPKGSALRLVVLTDSGRVLGYFKTAAPAGGAWGWVQAVGKRRTITLFDSLGRLIRATPYGKLEEPHESLLVVALPDSVLPGGNGAMLAGRRGVIDRQGREVVPPRYQYLENFNRGYAPIAALAGSALRQGLLDHQGREHWLGPEWDQAHLRYQGGFFSGATERAEAVAVGVDGRVLVPYSAGLSSIERTQYGAPGGLVQVRAYDRSVPGQAREGWGLYDTLLHPLLPPRYQGEREASTDWTVFEDFPATGPGALDLPRKGAAWRGHPAVPPTYSGVSISPDGRFALAGGYRAATRTVEYVVSERGGPPRPLPGYTDVRYLGHGVLAGCQHGQWGLLRTDGRLLSPCQQPYPTEKLQAGGYFGQGPGGWQLPLADTLGRVVLPAGQYEAAGFFTPTLAWVRRQNRYGIFNRRTGRLLVPLGFLELPHPQADGSYWGRYEGDKVLLGHGEAPPLTIAEADFQPVSTQWPYLVLGVSQQGTRWQLYNGQGQLLTTDVRKLEGHFRNGVIWAANAAGRYALLDTRGRLLTPFSYQLIIDLNENWAPFGGGLGLARTEAGATVVVDCLGRAYAW